MKLLNKIFIFLILANLFMLSGCVTTIPLANNEKQNIKTVRIDNTIQIPPEMALGTHGQNVAVGFGLVGLLIAEDIRETQGGKIEGVIVANHIAITDIVKQQFIQQMQSKTHFRVVNSNDADATLTIKIKEYGFNALAFSSKMSPVLNVEAELIKNNKIIWRDSSPVFASAILPNYHFEEYLQNPALITKAWNAAAAMAVNQMLRTM